MARRKMMIVGEPVPDRVGRYTDITAAASLMMGGFNIPIGVISDQPGKTSLEILLDEKTFCIFPTLVENWRLFA